SLQSLQLRKPVCVAKHVVEGGVTLRTVNPHTIVLAIELHELGNREPTLLPLRPCDCSASDPERACERDLHLILGHQRAAELFRWSTHDESAGFDTAVFAVAAFYDRGMYAVGSRLQGL